ncbi:MAG: methylated-DNA--[protein]-cysteine S-methyltransferase [Flavobacteriales bacterium]
MKDDIISITYWKSPLGELILGVYDEMICVCDWRYRKSREAIDFRIKHILGAQYVVKADPVASKTITQLQEYFSGDRKEFDIPMAFVGSEFQTSVWNALLQVDYGKTESYLNLSKRLGNEKAIRAVASANGANAISILVPCHRIIGSDGKLTGYAGGISVKKKLLELEGAAIQQQLDLF